MTPKSPGAWKPAREFFGVPLTNHASLPHYSALSDITTRQPPIAQGRPPHMTITTKTTYTSPVMKQIKTLLMAAAVALTAASCSQQEEPTPTPAPVETGRMQEVELSFSINAGNIANTPANGRGSRAAYDYSSVCFFPKKGDAYFDENPGKNFAPPRELDCENSWQQVNDVKVYVYKEDNAGVFRHTGKSYVITDFTNKFNPEMGGGPTAIWCGALANDTYTLESYYYTTREQMETGRYKFLAIARDDKGVDGTMLTIDGLTEGASLDEVTATGSMTGNRHQTSEFFWKIARDADGKELVYTVDDNTTALSVNIGKINRAVAGLLFYVENIPATKTAADGKAYSVDYIGISTGAFADATSPTKNLSSAKNTANPAGKPFGHHFGRASLKGFSVEDGYYVRDNPYSKNHPNALLLGSFVMPQSCAGLSAQKDAEGLTNSLYLVFYHEANGAVEPISWIPIKDGQSMSYAFDLTANQLYTLGTKRYTHDGHEYDDPAEDDQPVDLREHTGIADLVLHVCPYYEQSHTITIN